MPFLSVGLVSIFPSSPLLFPSMADGEGPLTTQSIGELSQQNAFYILLSVALEWKGEEIWNSDTKQDRRNTPAI